MLFAKVIKYEGDNKTFIWKHPTKDFVTGSQLIVHESQEAIFMQDGKVMDKFGPGRFTLTTANLPVISSLMKISRLEFRFHALSTTEMRRPQRWRMQTRRYWKSIPRQGFTLSTLSIHCIVRGLAAGLRIR